MTGDSPRHGVRLEISYERLWSDDAQGIVEITSDGDGHDWFYSCIGSHHGMQGDAEGEDPRVMEFGQKLADLVREHFGAVAPIVPQPFHKPGKRRRPTPKSAVPNPDGSPTPRLGAGREDEL